MDEWKRWIFDTQLPSLYVMNSRTIDLCQRTFGIHEGCHPFHSMKAWFRRLFCCWRKNSLVTIRKGCKNLTLKKYGDRTVTYPRCHLLPLVPFLFHTAAPMCEPTLTYTFSALTCGPYIWYQNFKHFPPVAVVAGMFALINLADALALALDTSKYM